MLLVEDEPYMAEAIRDGLRLEAIAADIAGDGDTALELLSVNAYDIAVLDRDIPGPSGDEIAKRIVASGSGMPILMLTAADRLDDKASGFELGADDYLTKPFELRELVLRLRALDRRRAHHRPPVREIAGLRLDPFRREVYRDGRYVALTRKQFAVLEVLVAAEGGVVSAEELLERAWDENADPFTNAVRITVSALRKRLGEPWIIATVAGAGYRIDTERRPWIGPRAERPPQAHAQLRRLPHARRRPAARRRVGVPPALRPRPAMLVAPADRLPARLPRPVRPPGTSSLRGRPPCWRSCWCSASWEGGSSPAGCSRPLTRITDATRMAATGSLSHRIRLEGRKDEFRELADAFDAMLARLEAHVAEQQRFAANASHELRTPLAITQTLLDVARKDPEPRQRRARRPPPRRQHPSDRPHRGAAPAQPRRPAVLHPRARRPVAHRRGGHRDAAPLRRGARRHDRDLRRRDPHHRLTRAPAADDDEPRAQRDRPQPARRGHRVGHDQRSAPERVVLTVENTGEKLTPQLVSTLAEPFQRGTERIRTDHAGVGLGLAIVKSIAQAHDGTLTLAPRAAGGLCVTVELPGRG